MVRVTDLNPCLPPEQKRLLRERAMEGVEVRPDKHDAVSAGAIHGQHCLSPARASGAFNRQLSPIGCLYGFMTYLIVQPYGQR